MVQLHDYTLHMWRTWHVQLACSQSIVTDLPFSMTFRNEKCWRYVFRKWPLQSQFKLPSASSAVKQPKCHSFSYYAPGYLWAALWQYVELKSSTVQIIGHRMNFSSRTKYRGKQLLIGQTFWRANIEVITNFFSLSSLTIITRLLFH